MKYLLYILLMITIIGCGKDPSSTKEEPISHQVYIIGGQSNALYLQNFIHNDPITTLKIYDNLDYTKALGYAVGGTNIDYWLQSQNYSILLDLITKHCNLNPYFVWYQGESAAYPILDLNYQTKLKSFFKIIKDSCSTLSIIEVSLADADFTYANEEYWNTIRGIQEQEGDFHFSAKNYTRQDQLHLSAQGYIDLWVDLNKQFPLN